MLSDEDISEFQALYKKHFGKEISREEAYDKGVRLIRLIKAVYKPMTKDDYDAVQKRREETKD